MQIAPDPHYFWPSGQAQSLNSCEKKSMGISRYLSVVVAVLMSSAVCSQQRYQSLLWKVTAPGSHEASYLYGTMHISGKLAFQLGDPFYDALESVDAVALELEPESWLEAIHNDPASPYWLASDFDLDFEYDEMAYDSPLPALVGNYRIDADLPSRLSDALSNDPQLLNYFLFRFSGEEGEADFQEDTWLDMHIYQTAKKLGKSTIGLETYDQSDAFLLKATLAEYTEMNEPQWGSRDFMEINQLQQQLEPAYRNQDLDLVDSLNRLTTTAAFRKYILDERSGVFVQTLDSLMKAGITTFAAMGCAHLPGEFGAIERLRRMGYNVEPISKGQRNAKRRKAYESKICSRTFTPFKTPDGQLTFYTPTKVYPLDVTNHSQSWISLDIANGASFTVTRLKSYATLQGLEDSELLSEVEGLIYESVAGEVVSNERIRAGKYEGFDIVSRTRRGDFRRQRILILPEEIVILKLTAPGKMAAQGYGSDFFGNTGIAIESNPKREWTSPDGELSVNMEGRTVFYNQAIEFRAIPDLEVVAALPAEGVYYLVQRHVIEDPEFIDEDRYELRRLLRAYCADRNCSVVDSSFIRVQGLPALDAILNDGQSNLHVRLVLKALAYYAFTTNHQQSSAVDAFFKSIKFQQQTEASSSTYRNDELCFTTDLPFVPAKPAISAEMMMFNPELQRDPHSPYGTNGGFLLNKRGETNGLMVVFQRYHEFSDGESRESFEQERRERAIGSTMELISKHEEWSGSDARFDYVVGAQGSVRRYAHTTVLHNKSCYTLIATYDSVFGLPSWIEHAIATFQSTDTIFPYPHFQSRDNAYFDDLLSTDSIARKKALEITGEMDFSSDAGPRIRQVLDSLQGFSTEEQQIISGKLIEGLALDTSSACIDFVAKEFIANSDSMEYQDALLAILLRMKTQKAWRTFTKLVLDEPPIASDTWNASYWLLLDSVKLAAPFMSDLKQLVAIDEYEEPIYRVMAQALDSGWYKADNYESMLPQILLEARNELKRLNANNEEGYAFNTTKLLDYASLLQPFRKRKDVEAFFRKAQSTKRMNLLLDLVAFDLEHHQPVADSLIEKIAFNKGLVYGLYGVLLKNHQVNRMPPTYAGRLDLIKAYLSSIETPSYYATADSVVIDTVYAAAIRSTPLMVYYCRMYSKEYNQWFGKVIAFDGADTDNWWPMFFESETTVLYNDDDAFFVLKQEYDYLEERNREVVTFTNGQMDFMINQY
jgi:uncharacterized protein YbaP (TraB family)